MKSVSRVGFEEVLECLRKLGLLLERDAAFPSITGIMLGAPIQGSWSTHPMANELYALSQRLIQHPDVIFLKLLSNKTSYVHRRLWPELIATATADEPWQLQGLPASAKSLLRKVEDSGRVRMDELKGPRTAKQRGEDARLLESRLLVFADNIQTDAGAPVKRIETWEHWAWRTGFQTSVLPTPERAKEDLSRIVARLNEEFSARARLPWERENVRAKSARARA